jgi:hypothetical protein
LVFLGAKGEGIDIDTGVGGTGVVLEGLDNIEVRSLTLGEAVLSVKLKLGGDNGVLSPAVHVKGGLGKDESSGIRETGSNANLTGYSVVSGRSVSKSASCECERSLISTIGTDGVGEGIDGIGVIERLGAKGLVEGGAAD